MKGLTWTLCCTVTPNPVKHRRFRAGDRVLVRSPEEILATLDAEGTLGGLPFMPEMVDWCGRPFTIQRRAEKTCVDSHPMRRFFANDVVILDGPRCDGRDHGGCQRGCRIFWKEAWLRPWEAATAPEVSETALQALDARLRVKSDEHRYFCQSTELLRATVAFPGKATLWMPWLALKEVLGRDISLIRMVKLFALWSGHKLWRTVAGNRLLRGPRKRTPAESLHLEPGEVVRVKSRRQIAETLDHLGRNRGMGICYEMLRCSGRRAEVRYRVERIIDEQSGVMRKLSETVVLHNAREDPALCEECLCYGEPGDCPRGELMYWREIWLERVNPAREDRRS
jgi:hypothetical protein